MIKQVGYIGLGKMGSNMVSRLLEHNWDVVAYNRSPEPVKIAEERGAIAAYSIKDMAERLNKPRLVWLMVPHATVSGVLSELTPFLSEGDIVIDGGNSNYNDSIRHAEELSNKGINFLDAGVSGGPNWARNGAAVMVGGKREIFERCEDIFRDISKDDGYGHMGDAGAGHFVKMVHNGIEYGMMQAIGEGFELMKRAPLDLRLGDIARVYQHGTVIESRLIDWLVDTYRAEGIELENISGEVSHSGEGLWTVEAAKNLKCLFPL